MSNILMSPWNFSSWLTTKIPFFHKISKMSCLNMEMKPDRIPRQLSVCFASSPKLNNTLKMFCLGVQSLALLVFCLNRSPSFSVYIFSCEQFLYICEKPYCNSWGKSTYLEHRSWGAVGCFVNNLINLITRLHSSFLISQTHYIISTRDDFGFQHNDCEDIIRSSGGCIQATPALLCV